MLYDYSDFVKMYESMEVFDGDPIEEICLFAWNDYDSYKQIESIAKSLKKKPEDEIKVDILAGSSVMQKLVSSIIKSYTKQIQMTFKHFNKKELYNRLASEIIERLSDF